MSGQDLFRPGVSLLSLEDVDGKEFVKELIKSANVKEPYIVSYKLRNPITQTIDQKYSYVKRVPQSDWIVGMGYYDNELHEKIVLKQLELKTMFEHEYRKIFLISLFIILISIVISYFISKKLRDKIDHYSQTLNDKNKELELLNISLEQKVQKRTTELSNAYKEMKEIAIKDSLTKVYNRYFFNDALENEIYRSNRYNSTFSLCMFDLDHFKRLNDTYGHDIGDEVLTTIAALIQGFLRESDIFARVGGEEFMIIFTKTTLDEAMKIAQRLRVEVQEHPFKILDKITISMGLVSYKDEELKHLLLKRVDNALYEAKRSGRNNVVVGD